MTDGADLPWWEYWAQQEVSTARGCNPEKDGAPGLGPVPAAGNLRIAIEEALASLEAGMVQGAADTLREALSSPSPLSPE